MAKCFTRIRRHGSPFSDARKRSKEGEASLGGLCKHIHNLLFPYSVSTVFGETLFEAEHRGLEGPAPGKGPLRSGATLRKQCGSINRVNGQRKGEGRLAPCRNILNQLFPNSVSTVFGETLFEAEHRGLEGPAPGKGPFRWSAVFQK